ncbi:MAG: hypothetical protein ABEJ36_00505 [Candidatus Nanosalina sp.]
MGSTEGELPEVGRAEREILDDHEDIADKILDHGEVYRSLADRRGLEKTYDELGTEEKWDYALEVLKTRIGERYDRADEAIYDWKSGELGSDDLTWTTRWDDDYQKGRKNLDVRVESPDVTPVEDGRVSVRAEVHLEGEDEDNIVYRLFDDREKWEEQE